MGGSSFVTLFGKILSVGKLFSALGGSGKTSGME